MKTLQEFSKLLSEGERWDALKKAVKNKDGRFQLGDTAATMAGLNIGMGTPANVAVGAAMLGVSGALKGADIYKKYRENRKQPKMKMSSEEAETLSELSKKTLKSYVKKANTSFANEAGKYNRKKPNKKNVDKMVNRRSGISNALDRLDGSFQHSHGNKDYRHHRYHAKEEIELSELSNKTLNSYRRKVLAKGDYSKRAKGLKGANDRFYGQYFPGGKKKEYATDEINPKFGKAKRGAPPHQGAIINGKRHVDEAAKPINKLSNKRTGKKNLVDNPVPGSGWNTPDYPSDPKIKYKGPTNAVPGSGWSESMECPKTKVGKKLKVILKKTKRNWDKTDS